MQTIPRLRDLAKMSGLFTARLVLDPFVPGDSADLFTVRGDPEVMKFWDRPHDSDPSLTIL
jgi:hypothetical protein